MTKKCVYCNKYYFGEECLECKDKTTGENDLPDCLKDLFGSFKTDYNNTKGK